ncbi:hypothetical protein PVAP13_2NG014400 [Panicum virgatum]|uniref:Uncharacterized protein n=1 Tax=Panicum virgatum TaxID=38727 RepID=A0A8T0V7T9_PANVG|nr:hypothetical protein PVAP13_2NG014400 [Panicum virgatum]
MRSASAGDSIYGPRVYPIKVCTVVYQRKRLKNRAPPTRPALRGFLARVSRPTVSLLREPAPRVQRRRTMTPVKVPRRSRRLAIAARRSEADATRRAQAVLMRKLGIIGESEHISIDAQDDYACLFMQELSQTHIAALAALFGWSVPDDAEVRGVDLCVWV